MDLDTAQKIIDAFGPCTELYECSTAGEIVAEYGKETARDFAELMLSVLAIQQSRDIGSADWSDINGDARHKSEIERARQIIVEIKQRLREAGIL